MEFLSVSTIIIIPLVLIIIGFLVRIHSLRSESVELSFVEEYTSKFDGLVDSYKDGYFDVEYDNELYEWLAKKLPKLQRTIGPFGVAARYQAPYSNQIDYNYEIIPNTLTLFKLGTVHSSNIHYSKDALLHYIGDKEDSIYLLKKDLFNPLKLFVIGVQILVSSPLALLHWFGLIVNNNNLN